MHGTEVGEQAAAPEAARLFAGPGEMRAHCRARDWAATPLGPVAEWPGALRAAAAATLASSFSSVLLWGPDLVQLYNDGYVRFLGVKHPAALGQPTFECWPELRSITEPIYQRVLAGETVTAAEQHFPLQNGGPDAPVEDVYITISYAPAGEPGAVGGVLVTAVDVTAQVTGRRAEAERARLAAALDAERTRVLEEVFRRSPAFLHVLRGPNFVFEFANEAYYALVGRHDLLGRPAFEALPEAAAGSFPERLARVMATGEPFAGRELPVTLARTPGAPPEERLVDLVYLPLLDADGAGSPGRCTRVLGHGVDVTEDVRARRAIEAELAASEARFRAVQDASPLGFAIHRPLYGAAGTAGADAIVNFSTPYINEAGARIVGRTREQVMAGTFLSIWPATRDVGVFADYVRVLETGEPCYRELLYEHDGLAAGLAITAVRIGDGPGAELGITFDDITARLRAEQERVRLLAELGAERERLRTVILQMPAPVALAEGAEHRFTLVNDAFCRISGGGRDVTGLTTREAFPEVAGQGFYERFDRVYATGEPWAGPETLVRFDRDGTGVQDTWFDLRLEPVRDAEGRVTGVLNFAIDVTTQVRARRDVERLLRESEAARREAEAARAAADAANRAKSEFLAVMSHEIRTPINAITGYAQLLELEVAGPVTPAQRDYLGRLVTASAHLLGLVNDVLDLAKIDAGEFSVARTPAAAGEAVAAALDLVRPQGAARGVRLAADAPAGVTYVGDEHRVRQILVNLLSNAVKFTGPGGSVTASCALVADVAPAARVAGDGPWAFMRVADTGIGIAPAEQAAVFEPFHQVEQGHTRTRGGTGLGLAISRRLARLMGGDLTLESTPGVGSAFTLWLPGVGAGGGADESAPARVARAAHAEPSMVRGLGELGALLRRQVDAVVQAYAERLRAEPAAPLARGMRQPELEDHLVTGLADFAQSLVIVGEAEAAAAGLLADSVAINQVVAERHGARRFAQGWDEAALRADYAVLREVLARVIRADARARGSSAGGADVEAALAILLGLVEQSEARALAAWRVAHTADGRSAGGRAAL